MLGWIVQKYGNEPVVITMMGLLRAPGAMAPVSKAPPFAVAVCAELWALRQITRCPTCALEGFGE